MYLMRVIKRNYADLMAARAASLGSSVASCVTQREGQGEERVLTPPLRGQYQLRC